MDKKRVEELKLQATCSRQNVLRMLRASGAGHLGGALSAIDILTALYFHKMNVDPKEPHMADRDRFILSAGHKCLAQYAVLAEKGFFEKEILDTYGDLGAKIPGHPDMYKLPGVEANTGALGHGLSIGVGMALGFRMENKDANVYVVMGDGELAEGSNWEAAAAASHHQVDNLVAFVDYNGLQISGAVDEVMNFTPIAERFEAFGWETIEIDGNDMNQIVDVLDRLPLAEGKPTMIVAHTVKSKGISFAENHAGFHYWKTTEESLAQAEEELCALADLNKKAVLV